MTTTVPSLQRLCQCPSQILVNLEGMTKIEEFAGIPPSLDGSLPPVRAGDPPIGS
jgi:hypothetical protein